MISGAAANVAALTTDRRDKWAANRLRFFVQIPKNRRALEVRSFSNSLLLHFQVIESAAFMIVLTEEDVRL